MSFFAFRWTQSDILPYIFDMIFSSSIAGQKWRWVPPPEMSPDTKTPEMNELESDKQNLKSGAPNFEKQKNDSVFKARFFFEKKPRSYPGNEFAL